MSPRAFALIVGLCMAAAGSLAGAAWGQGGASASLETKPIGKVQSVTGSVTIEHTNAVPVQASAPASGGVKTKIDDPVYLGDVVQTQAGSAIGVIFGDGTSFNISENARMEINEFVYDPKGTSNSTLFNLTKGTFTFLAGKTAKTGNMRVETPVGTMGIRGTAPHVEILDDGTVKFTTLVEENKNTTTEAPAKTKPAERRADKAAPTAPRTKAEKDLSNMLNICKGC